MVEKRYYGMPRPDMVFIDRCRLFSRGERGNFEYFRYWGCVITSGIDFNCLGWIKNISFYHFGISSRTDFPYFCISLDIIEKLLLEDHILCQ